MMDWVLMGLAGGQLGGKTKPETQPIEKTGEEWLAVRYKNPLSDQLFKHHIWRIDPRTPEIIAGQGARWSRRSFEASAQNQAATDLAQRWAQQAALEAQKAVQLVALLRERATMPL